jgi:hypothetical protein
VTRQHHHNVLHYRDVLCCVVLCVVQYAEGMVFKVYLQEGRIAKSTELAELVNTEE